MSTLFVIVNDSISGILQKGEYSDRYYNPGNLFSEVHILMTNNDRPDIQLLQKTVGTARLFVHNLPADRKLFVRSFGWRPALLKDWVAPAIKLARELRPSLIRCHYNHLNAFAALSIKQELATPYVVSLHINPDEDGRKRIDNWRSYLILKALKRIEEITLKNADLVLPVYLPIVPYLERLGIEHYEVCYNVINPAHLKRKNDYSLHDPVRIISIGRQFKEKNPENLIKAVASIPNAELTMVGDGPYHEHLKKVASDSGIAKRVIFYPAIKNDHLCSILPDYDIFATHSEYWELSKSVLEPLLTGLPVIINRRKGQPVPELRDNICVLVENSVEGYFKALKCLIEDNSLRERLGNLAYDYAQANWAPEKTEASFVEIYKRFMKKSTEQPLSTIK